jgi:LmbE family N-acetylglucosaminyl deacetylase
MNNIYALLNKIQNKVLLVVFPHPDDETMATGGLILAAKRAGFKLIVVSLTKGGAGKIFVHANGYSLKEVREKEFVKAINILVADEYILDDFDDGKLREQKDQVMKRLSNLMIKYKPGLVVTYDPSGLYGHPDHITVSHEIFKHLTGGEVSLLFVAVPPWLKKKLPLRGMKEVVRQMVEPTHILDLGWDFIKKWAAAKAHKSQGLGKSAKMPLWLYMAINHFEYYHQVSIQSKSKYNFKYINYQI